MKSVIPMLAFAPFLCRGRDVPTRAVVGGAPVAIEATAIDPETIRGPADFAKGFPPRNLDESVNAVVEIPSGTTAKFEVDAGTGDLRWEKRREDGARRAIDYLPYPANYGMVPRTLAADGDPIDVLVLGGGIERGHVAATRIIGVLVMANDDVRDDKLIAVPVEPAWRNGFSDLTDLEDLDAKYPAARDLLEMWFSFYWGPGATEVIGWGDAREAERLLDDAIDDAITPRGRECTARPGSSALRLRAAPRFVPRVREPAVPRARRAHD